MDIYVVYYIDSDWYSTRRIQGVCGTLFDAIRLIKSFEDAEEMEYLISKQVLDEEFTIELM